MSSDRDLERLLEAFAEAWNRHDVEALMSMMTEDGVFETSAVDQVNGERHEGHRAVRAAFEDRRQKLVPEESITASVRARVRRSLATEPTRRAVTQRRANL